MQLGSVDFTQNENCKPISNQFSLPLTIAWSFAKQMANAVCLCGLDCPNNILLPEYYISPNLFWPTVQDTQKTIFWRNLCMIRICSYTCNTYIRTNIFTEIEPKTNQNMRLVKWFYRVFSDYYNWLTFFIGNFRNFVDLHTNRRIHWVLIGSKLKFLSKYIQMLLLPKM
jgi:hypothetical protein